MPGAAGDARKTPTGVAADQRRRFDGGTLAQLQAQAHRAPHQGEPLQLPADSFFLRSAFSLEAILFGKWRDLGLQPAARADDSSLPLLQRQGTIPLCFKRAELRKAWRHGATPRVCLETVGLLHEKSEVLAID